MLNIVCFNIRMSDVVCLDIRISNDVGLNIQLLNVVWLNIRMSEVVYLDIRLSNVVWLNIRKLNVEYLANFTHLLRTKMACKEEPPCKDQGPIVQSVVSLKSSLRVILLTVLADSIYYILIFFAKKYK